MPGKAGGKAKPLKAPKASVAAGRGRDGERAAGAASRLCCWLVLTQSEPNVTTTTTTRLHAPSLCGLQSGDKVVTDEDLAFKKKQQEEAKALRDAAAKLKK
jgi:hypothetical protein